MHFVYSKKYNINTVHILIKLYTIVCRSLVVTFTLPQNNTIKKRSSALRFRQFLNTLLCPFLSFAHAFSYTIETRKAVNLWLLIQPTSMTPLIK